MQTKNGTHVHLMCVYMCDVHNVDLKILGVKIFLSFALVTKIKTHKFIFPIHKVLVASATDEN